jgi:hypothetical protein
MSTNSPMRRVRPADWAEEPPIVRPAFRKNASWGVTRVLISFCVGIAATLAWQSYGDAVREITAKQYPQLAWLAPRAPVASPAPVVPPIASADPAEIRAISLGLAAVRQSVDQLTAGQDQINRDMTTKLQAAKQEILDRMTMLSPQPAAPPVRKPAPPAAPLH